MFSLGFSPFSILLATTALVVAASDYGDDDQQDHIKKELILLDINFAHEFYKFDPRSDASAFNFGQIYTATDLRTDNAAFLRHAGTDLVDMVSLPFNHWLPQNTSSESESQILHQLSDEQRLRDDVSPQLAAYDGSAISKQPYSVERGQVLKFTYRFTCQTLNTQEVAKRFPYEAILNYKDDPRLAACDFAVSDQLDTGLEFGIYATNNGVWAKYSANTQARYQLNGGNDAFDIYRRIGSRASVDEIIDARMEIDPRRGEHRTEVRYFLNDKLVWRVKNLGLLTKSLFGGGGAHHQTANRLVTYSPGPQPRTVAADPSSFTLYLANTHKTDEADPNRMDDDGGKQYSPGLVRLVAGVPHFYGSDIWFWDEHSERYNSLAGQGAISGMERLTVTVCDAHLIHKNDGEPDEETADL